jgi:glutathione S-transferase
MKLYDFYLSGHAYKVRLMLSLLHLEHEVITVDLSQGQQRSPEFLALNLWGQVPVLLDQDYCLADSHAILWYLASQYGPAWLPKEPAQQAEVVRWLSFAANETRNGPGYLRLVKVFGAAPNEAAVVLTEKVLSGLEQHLSKRRWLVGDNPTIADLAVYAYVALSPDGGVDLQPYPEMGQWIVRVQSLPGYLDLPKAP